MKPPPFDDRPFVRLDHGMPENPKVVGLSDAAFRLYVESLCWCSRQESDGDIPSAAMKRLGRPKPLAELVSARLLDKRRDGSYSIHDYLAHQRSKAEIAAFRQSRSDIGKGGNHVRWHVARRRFDSSCEFCQTDQEPIAEPIAEGSQEGSLDRSQKDRYPVASTDADADAAISSSHLRVVGDELPSSFIVTDVTRGSVIEG